MTQSNSDNKYRYWEESDSQNMSSKNVSTPESVEHLYSENFNYDNYDYENYNLETSEIENYENEYNYENINNNDEYQYNNNIEEDNSNNSSTDNYSHNNIKEDNSNNLSTDNHPPYKNLNYIKNLENLAINNSLDFAAQEELSKLIILRNKIERLSRHDWLKLIDYAILILEKKPTENNIISQPQQLSFLDKITNQYNNKIYGQSNHVNLRLARSIRKKIQWQVLFYTSPLLGIITASGKDYTQLISGLTWFFFIFVIFPYYAVTLFVSNERSEIQKDMEFFNKTLLEENANLEIQIQELRESNNILRFENIESSSNLEQLQIEKSEQDNIIKTLRLQQAELQDIIQDLQKPPESQEKPQAKLNKNSNNQAIFVGNYSFKKGLDSNEMAINSNVYNNDIIIAQEIDNLENINTQNNELSQVTNQSFLKNKLYFENRETTILIIAVVIAGALGSAVSVIVRADDIISQHNKKTQSLFFTGFFKPIIGMSFAIFLFAVLESNILGISLSMTGEKKLYMYIAVSFVAGFSERLGKDIISKTEDTLIPDDDDELRENI